MTNVHPSGCQYTIPLTTHLTTPFPSLHPSVALQPPSPPTLLSGFPLPSHPSPHTLTPHPTQPLLTLTLSLTPISLTPRPPSPTPSTLHPHSSSLPIPFPHPSPKIIFHLSSPHQSFIPHLTPISLVSYAPLIRPPHPFPQTFLPHPSPLSNTPPLPTSLVQHGKH